jgi:RNA polymerase subunit RPABC4/transcription elongation factor Spt4
LLKKPRFPALIKNKLLLLTIILLAVTIVLAILFVPRIFLVLGIGGPATFIAGFIFLLSWNRPTAMPVPAKVEIKAEPKEIIADGVSKSFITIQLLDKKGKPIAAPDDTEVKLTTTGGKLERAVVKIPKGKEKAETVLISSKETGKIDLAADASGLESIDIKLNFTQKPRYCMHCGTMMTLNAKACQNCGNTPLAGVDTKACPNCESVIPVAAKFCSECGAGQAA